MEHQSPAASTPAGERIATALAGSSGDLRGSLAAVRNLLRMLCEAERGWRELEQIPVSDLLQLGERLLDLLPEAEQEGDAAVSAARSALHDWLDATRRSPFLRRIAGEPEGEKWLDLVLRLARASNYTTGALLRHRAARAPGRVWLRVMRKGTVDELSLGEALRRVEAIARGLHSLFPTPPSGQPVALLAENAPGTVLADLACLTSGLVNTTIPADATVEHVAYILEQVEARVLLVGSDRQVEKVLPVLRGLPHLQWVVQIGEDGVGSTGAREESVPATEGESGRGMRWLSWQELLRRGREISEAEFQSRCRAVRFDDPATLMFTSGTTGLPKGIRFSHRNIVFKRFARALALPEIGENDRFLCYLPLYHTFGRWLEMTGTLFWGATYAFMESPALETMLDNLRRASPTVFISIPKKWIQLHEHVLQSAPEGTEARRVREVLNEATGGRLRWGLSAAGFLDPAVFRFFQRHGVELMSGFGMTEATGGITLTPPGGYRDGTVGVALPGIELRREDDGELVVRGPYVMEGYFGPDEATADYTTEWFHTGDIVSMDTDGYVTIIDRKKDIYKNVKGQTVAPQRVESLFQSFGEVQQAFLVGDGREYNSLLIYPNYEHLSPPLGEMSPEELREYLSSVVVSVNGFLAPFERILDFAVLPRPLTLEAEELTPKGTYRRKVVEEHFAELISGMYATRVSRWRAGDLEIRIPHWLLRDMGLTLQDLDTDREGLYLPRLGRVLPLGREEGRVRVGDLHYEGAESEVDLEVILRSPELWLGNAALVSFTGPAGIRRPQRRRDVDGEMPLRVAGLAQVPQLAPEERQRMRDALWREDRSLGTLHLAAVALLSASGRDASRIIDYLEHLAGEEDPQRAELARIALRRTVGHPRRAIRSAAFRALLPHGSPEMVAPTMLNFLRGDPAVLNRSGAEALARRGLPDEVMAAFLAFAARIHDAREVARRVERPGAEGATARGPEAPVSGGDGRGEAAPVHPASPYFLPDPETLAVLRFLVIYATDHPGWYVHVRHELTRWLLSTETFRIRDFARRGLDRLVASFRRWLGPDPQLALDPVTGREYGWRHVIHFDPDCDPEDRRRIEEAISSVPLLKEAIFILFAGVRVSLAEIPRGGIRIRHLGTRHGKAVYRLTVQTRASGSFEVALNLIREGSEEAAETEVLWLTRLGSPSGGRRLVEDLGGYWAELHLWSEEFVAGETLSALLRRLAAEELESAEDDRLLPLWTHLASSAAATYIEFWRRTDRQLVPGDPSPENLIVPAHDYQEGSRLVSISERQPFVGLAAFLGSLRSGILERVCGSIPQLEGMVSTEPLYSAVLDVFGEEQGTRELEALLEDAAELERFLPGETEKIQRFLDRMRAGGYMPRRLAAAIRRYHRWADVNPGATLQACARTLHDLWDSYGLRDLETSRPETRIRLFRETVFGRAGEELRGELARLIEYARSSRINFDALLREMSEWVQRMQLGEDDLYFLARMTYAHLRPTETADLTLVEQGGTKISDLVVTHRDQAGRYFRVRHASSPREVWALHQLFYASGIHIRFRAGHQFLVAVDENNKVLGGLVYRLQDRALVHMEKIVVSPTHRRQGISEELMEDFFQRLRDRGIRAVTTGFFRHQYFRRFQFQIDREHAGLVKLLEEKTVVKAETAEPA